MNAKKIIKNKKAIFSIIVIMLLVMMFILVYNPKELISEQESLITIQESLEKDFVSKGYNLDKPNVILNPYGNSPLTALIIFETKKEVAPTLTIKGKDKSTTISKTFTKSKIHYIPVLGLYADKENEVTININGEEKNLIIETEPLPKNAILPEYVYSDKSKLDDELYFFTPSSDGLTCAYDINGDIRWYLTNDSAWKIDRLENGNLLLSTENLLNPPYYTTGLYEMDMLGKIHSEYLIEGGYHHDYFELENGNLLVLSNDFNTNKVEDVIVEIDRKTGDVIRSIDLKNILNQEDGKSEDWISYDWFHNNSVWYDKVTNSITLSGRHQDAVINIDYETEQLNWIIGDSTNWSEEFQQYFFTPVGDDFEWQWAQHAAMITPEGHAFILDNGNNKSKDKEDYVPANNSYTRGVMYDINTEDMTIRQIWQFGKERGSEFYSPYISDVDYINNGHYIVHSGGIVYVDGEVSNSPAGLTHADKLVSNTVELLDNEIIFEIKLPTNNYRVEKMDMYGSFEFKLGKTHKYGSLGETKVDENNNKLILNTNKIDDKYKSKEITFEKDENRLIVTGNLTKNDDVKILLSKFGNVKEYKVKVSKRPYTALCIDIFSDECLSVSKYINKEGLSGKYNIFIELNGKIYDVNKAVEF